MYVVHYVFDHGPSDPTLKKLKNFSLKTLIPRIKKT